MRKFLKIEDPHSLIKDFYSLVSMLLNCATEYD